jgi:hypothetical protein
VTRTADFRRHYARHEVHLPLDIDAQIRHVASLAGIPTSDLLVRLIERGLRADTDEEELQSA